MLANITYLKQTQRKHEKKKINKYERNITRNTENWTIHKDRQIRRTRMDAQRYALLVLLLRLQGRNRCHQQVYSKYNS